MSTSDNSYHRFKSNGIQLRKPTTHCWIEFPKEMTQEEIIDFLVVEMGLDRDEILKEINERTK